MSARAEWPIWPDGYGTVSAPGEHPPVYPAWRWPTPAPRPAPDPGVGWIGWFRDDDGRSWRVARVGGRQYAYRIRDNGDVDIAHVDTWPDAIETDEADRVRARLHDPPLGACSVELRPGIRPRMDGMERPMFEDWRTRC